MVRAARYEDLDRILEIYQVARQYMEKNGNPTQWAGGYPVRALLESDIEKGQLYAVEDGGRVHGAFVFFMGEEPTYKSIAGAWPNDLPYGVIHRVAGDGTVGGVFTQCVGFCAQQIGRLRIDTHEHNRTMRHLIEKHGFARCGIIRVEDLSPRIAYHYETA